MSFWKHLVTFGIIHDLIHFLHFLISTFRVFEITHHLALSWLLQLPLLTLGYVNQTLFCLIIFSRGPIEESFLTVESLMGLSIFFNEKPCLL